MLDDIRLNLPSLASLNFWVNWRFNTLMRRWCTFDFIIFTCPCQDTTDSVKHLLHGQFQLKDLGSFSYVLSFELFKFQHVVFFIRGNYRLQLLKNIGFLSL